MQGGDSEVAWQVTHEALEAHARKRAGLDFEEGTLLLAARRAEVHRHFGYGSFVEYVEHLLGYAPRVTHDKLRVAKALEVLPETARELRDGAIPYSQVRELTRVATPETEQIWLERAQRRTAREVEQLVSGRSLGSLPDSPVDPAQQRHVLRFEVTGETLASFREVKANLQREAGEHSDDDALLLQLARHVLGGPGDDGRASYQVVIDVCEDCGRAKQIADGEAIDVSPTVAAMARCDAQRLPQQLPDAHVGAMHGDSLGRGTHDARPAVRAAQDVRPSVRAAQDVRPSVRATQDVPPAARRAVLRRDQHCCRVPGCRHAQFVDIHHLKTREDGGDHEPRNLVTLCGAHHRAIHEGTLTATLDENNELVVSHADGTPYGAVPSAAASLVHTRAFQALRGLSFGDGDVRRALAEARREMVSDVPLDELLRYCLERLTARVCPRGY